MALKDWKHKWSIKDRSIYEKKGTKKRLMIIKDLDNTWLVVATWKSSLNNILKVTNTKAQALRYAKSYMRKH